MRRVIKIGGSLLLRDDLIDCLNDCIEKLVCQDSQPSETLLVVGGGKLIEAIRNFDRVHPCDPVQTHWRCVQLLSHTAQMLHHWFPAWHYIESAETFRHGLASGFPVDKPTLVAAHAFYRPDSNSKLPLDWRTTTDSIAGLLGSIVAADKVLLIKSCHVADDWTLDRLVQQGIIDEAMLMFRDADWQLSVTTL